MANITKFFDCYIPITSCNLRCGYCYIAQQKRFNDPLPRFEHTAIEIGKALSLKRLGGECYFNLCAGGETLLSPNVIEITKVLLEEGHYVSLITNGTLTRRIEELCHFPIELKKRLHIKFSFHYLELKRLGIVQEYFENVRNARLSGISITVELTPCDEEIPYIDEIKKFCLENVGALCHVSVARKEDDLRKEIPVLTNLSREEYLNTWGTFNSCMFDFKMQTFPYKRREFCYAGEWSFSLDLGSGDYRQCVIGKRLGNVFEDYEKPLNTEPIGKHCPLAQCFNGHAYLALGDIPEIEAPPYSEIRNRTCSDGTEWLSKDVRDFFSSKLYEKNAEWGRGKKALFELKHVAHKTVKTGKKWILQLLQGK